MKTINQWPEEYRSEFTHLMIKALQLKQLNAEMLEALETVYNHLEENVRGVKARAYGADYRDEHLEMMSAVIAKAKEMPKTYK